MYFTTTKKLMKNIHQNRSNFINEAKTMNEEVKEHFFNIRWYLDEY